MIYLIFTFKDTFEVLKAHWLYHFFKDEISPKWQHFGLLFTEGFFQFQWIVCCGYFYVSKWFDVCICFGLRFDVNIFGLPTVLAAFFSKNWISYFEVSSRTKVSKCVCNFKSLRPHSNVRLNEAYPSSKAPSHAPNYLKKMKESGIIFIFSVINLSRKNI